MKHDQIFRVEIRYIDALDAQRSAWLDTDGHYDGAGWDRPDDNHDYGTIERARVAAQWVLGLRDPAIESIVIVEFVRHDREVVK